MYWFRNQSITASLPWLLAAALWTLGGWLIITHLFNAGKKERLIFGFGLGLVLYLWLANLVGHWFAPAITYFLPALAILAIGLLAARRSANRLLDAADLNIWPILLLWAGVFVYSLLLERGLMIYDDQLHLPAISVMGAGSLPPRYFLNASSQFAYHYGFDLLGASLMRTGGMFAWSASDLSKALVWSFSLVMLGYLANQFIKNKRKTIAGVLAFTFLGNTRYILMLLPATLLQSLDHSIGFLGVSAVMKIPFSQSLFMPWTVIPGPPTPYTFGFISGIYASYHMFHTGQWPLALVIIGLIWLLASRVKSWKSIPFLTILWAQLALTDESSYALLAASLVILFLFLRLARKSQPVESFRQVLIALLISIPIVLFQGGALISIVQNTLLKFTGSQPLVSVHDKAASMFSFNWPPTIFSGTFGDLSLFDPSQLLVGLLEIGPVLLFVPLIVRWAVKKFTPGNWMLTWITLSTLIGFFISIFIRYNPSRDAITRFAEYAITFWYLFLIILIFSPGMEIKKWTRILAIGCSLLAAVSGVANFSAQFSAIPKPVLSDHITGLDAQISSQVWGSLPENEIIFDPNALPGRASEVTGLPTLIWEYRQILPFWYDLYKNPSLQGILQNHFRYVYIDERWWSGLTPAQRESLSDGCIQVIAQATADNEFRKLLDLGKCTLAGQANS
jgi:hypothetical protein